MVGADQGDFAKKQQSGESYVDYFVRLFDNKKIYGLTCDQIPFLTSRLIRSLNI